MPYPRRCKNAPPLWAIDKPEVSLRNFIANPQRPQANKEKMNGKK
jgi:hypothetical protein